jgi:Kdo2-lipid IVA lauroyltransferase/acyltransferase
VAVPTAVRWRHRAEAWAYQRYLDHFGNMAFSKASDAGADWMSAIGPKLSRHRTMLGNLRLAFPNARAAWAQMGRTAAELPHMKEITFAPGDERAVLIGKDKVDAVRASGKGAVFVGGHLANFELIPVVIVRHGLTCAMSYRPVNNPLIDQKLLAMRIGYGATLQAAKGREGGMTQLRALKRGHCVAMLNDQKYDEGLPVAFFGHTAMTTDAAARMAYMFDVPLIPLAVRRVENTRFVVTAHDPLPIDRTAPADKAVRDAVLAISKFIEDQVRAAPEQWFWVHNRWPKPRAR